MGRQLASFDEPFCPLRIYGHPKSGTTWLQLLTSRIKLDVCMTQKTQCGDCIHTAKHKFTDLHMNHLSIYRHPCNVAVSMFFFGNQTSDDINDYVRKMLNTIILRQNIQFRNEYNSKIIYYESLCQNTEQTLCDVVNHFQLPTKMSTIRRIMNDTNFEQMRKMELSRRMILSKHPLSYMNFRQHTLRHVMTREGCKANYTHYIDHKTIEFCHLSLQNSLMYRMNPT